MMMSMFSVFDPVSVMGVSFNWISLFLFLLVIPLSSFLISSRKVEIVKMILGGVASMFSDIASPNFLGLVYLGVGLFLLISVNNVFGLFSFVFTGTSHLIVTLSMGVMVWMMGMLMGWLKSFKKMSAHLVPEGAPLFLAPFMVMIETISLLIRPVTLSVRLAANMMAGHLIIGLISMISMISISSFTMSVFLQSLMLMLEWAVVFIQAFVFSVLVVLYSLESY